jgi:hypothetical protein
LWLRWTVEFSREEIIDAWPSLPAEAQSVIMKLIREVDYHVKKESLLHSFEYDGVPTPNQINQIGEEV